MGNEVAILANEKSSLLIDRLPFLIISENNDDRWLNSLGNG
jgi:hypothetical protein